MLAYIAPRVMTAAEAVGDSTLEDFLSLCALHRDGWGYASTSSRAGVSVSTGITSTREGVRAAGAQASAAAITYLRFASAGTAVSAANLQPFAADGAAFAHNGALTPREPIERALDPQERAALRGTTDSEMYFALVRRHLRGRPSAAESGATVATTIATAVAEVRALYPAACLNALLLVGGALVVAHSRGTVDPPLRAFADRGAELDDLPPGHDRTYNTLFTTVLSSGARVVTTTGVDVSQWTPLADDTVYVFPADGVARTAGITSERYRSDQPNGAATGSA